jgi:hypothetical protein
MLKTQIAALEEVSEALREHYVRNGSGGFRLATDDDRAASLRSALDAERQHRKTAENRARELEEQLRIARAGKESPTEETPREKFIRENAPRLKPFASGSDEWKAELAKIEAEMEPLITAEVAASRQEKEHARRALIQEYVGLRTDLEARAIATRIAVA